MTAVSGATSPRRIPGRWRRRRRRPRARRSRRQRVDVELEELADGGDAVGDDGARPTSAREVATCAEARGVAARTRPAARAVRGGVFMESLSQGCGKAAAGRWSSARQIGTEVSRGCGGGRELARPARPKMRGGRGFGHDGDAAEGLFAVGAAGVEAAAGGGVDRRRLAGGTAVGDVQAAGGELDVVGGSRRSGRPRKPESSRLTSTS